MHMKTHFPHELICYMNNIRYNNAVAPMIVLYI